MSEDKIEQISKALHAVHAELIFAMVGQEYPYTDFWKPFAIAAIKAMSEPTDEQIDAGVAARQKLYEKMERQGIDTRTLVVANHPAGTIYQAMVDCCLPGGPVDT